MHEQYVFKATQAKLLVQTGKGMDFIQGFRLFFGQCTVQQA